MFCDDCNRNPDCHAVWKTHGDRATNCVCWTPKRTKADMIRNMTDEELATWLGVYCNGQTAQEVGKPCASDMGSCEECWLDWLKQEAEEGE